MKDFRNAKIVALEGALGRLKEMANDYALPPYSDEDYIEMQQRILDVEKQLYAEYDRN